MYPPYMADPPHTYPPILADHKQCRSIGMHIGRTVAAY